MTVRAHTVRRTLATLSLGLLLLPAATFAKGSSSSSPSHSSSSSHTTTPVKTTTVASKPAASVAAPAKPTIPPAKATDASKPTINLAKATDTPAVKTGINLAKASDTPSAKPGINLSKPTDTAHPATISLAKTAPTALAMVPRADTPVPPSGTVLTTAQVRPATIGSGSTIIVPSTTLNASHGNWFGGNYEVFDRGGVAASRVYRSDSAFSTARWLLDHKAYHVRQVPNAGYELRTSNLVLDAGTPAFDRWIEQNR